ncbi:MAG TPA: homoserine dehydrogenase [Bacteroidales bacterium]|nr:homoserine dehydrogenase [Bacteroidales bacterium]
MKKKIRLGIFGFGCVGQGLYSVLQQTRGINAEIKKICIKHPEKKRSIDASLFTTNRDEILNDPDIDVVVELIDEVDAAFEIVSAALKKGKAVVSANKKMIAENFTTLLELQNRYKTPFLYEASCCASIPVIRNLEEYYDNDLLTSVEGILNGSTNYILTHIFNHDQTFAEALKNAQELGYAETDPSLDIQGLDPKYKLLIILVHAFGIILKPGDIFNYGIGNLKEADIRYAQEKNASIKLIALCKKTGSKVYAYCMPRFVPLSDALNKVNYEYNGLLIEGAFSEHQFFMGKGAGGNATGSAVLSDISALTYDYKYEYKKITQQLNPVFTQDVELEVYASYHNGIVPDIRDFESISVKHESPGFNYLIGKINLSTLRESAWLQHPSISIVLTESNR